MAISVPLHTWREGSATPLVLVHGFAGHGESWEEVAARYDGTAPLLSLTLPGHDRAAPVPRGATFESIVDSIAEKLVGELGRPIDLAGYSLGGRVVLGLLARHREIARRAVLIGASPGLATEEERHERAASDERIARLLEEEGIEAFVDRWERLPLFDSQRGLAPEILARQREIRLRHDPRALAAALRALGLASMPDYRPSLPDIAVPVLAVAGSLDRNFCDFAGLLGRHLRHGTVRVVPGAGHNIPFERPGEAARLLPIDNTG